MNKFYTPKEVADYLKVSTYTIYEWIKAGKLKAYRIGRGLRVKDADLQAFVEGRTA